MLEFNRMTAPDPWTITVFVDSENGSRLSLPSMVRAPFTVMGTSSATGWGFAVESPGGPAVSESFVVGGMACTPVKRNFAVCPL